MTDRTIVTEFGSSKINVGLPGEGIPLKSWNCGIGGESGFLVSSSSNQQSTPSFSLRGRNNNNNKNKDNSSEFQLFDVESCGLWSSQNSPSNWLGDQTFHLRHNIFGGGCGDVNSNQDSSDVTDSNNIQIHDVEIASQVFSQLLSKSSFIGASNNNSDRNLLFVPSDQIFKNDATFQSWCEMILETGFFSSFFPIRPAVAATIDSGRPSAVVLDCGHSSARINLVVDGVQRLLSPAFMASSLNCAGKNISKKLESAILEEITTNNNNNNNNSEIVVNEDFAAAVDGNNDNSNHGNDKNWNGKFFNAYFPSATTSPFQTASRFKILQEIKHSCGYVNNHFDSVLFASNDSNGKSSSSSPSLLHPLQQNKLDGQVKPAIFVAPDGEQVLISGATRSQCFEELFVYHGPRTNSSSNEKNSPNRDLHATSVVDLVVDLFAALPGDYKVALPLLCVGGTCRTEGFASRLSSELQKADSLFQRVNPAFPQDPFSQWRGASFLCSAPAFEDKGSWITKQKMEELGVNKLRKSIP